MTPFYASEMKIKCRLKVIWIKNVVEFQLLSTGATKAASNYDFLGYR